MSCFRKRKKKTQKDRGVYMNHLFMKGRKSISHDLKMVKTIVFIGDSHSLRVSKLFQLLFKIYKFQAGRDRPNEIKNNLKKKTIWRVLQFGNYCVVLSVFLPHPDDSNKFPGFIFFLTAENAATLKLSGK